jgi:hypothetical protein
MQERQHVKTTPGEAHASPEFAPHAVQREEGGNVQHDDINIPLVATMVAFFGALLAVTIVSLQAWIYAQQAAETEAQTVKQPDRDPSTWLGAILTGQRKEIETTGPVRDTTGGTTKPGVTPPPPKQRITIEQAMQLVEANYKRPRS